MSGLQRRKPELWTRAQQRAESSKLLAAIKKLLMPVLVPLKFWIALKAVLALKPS